MPALTDSKAANVRWNISVPPDFDESTRLFLASQGGKKGALSQLVQKAVSLYIIREITAEAKDRVAKAGLSQEDLDQIIAEGIAWARETES